MTPDWSGIFNAIVGGGTLAIVALLYKAIRTLDKLVGIIEGTEPPGVLQRLRAVEKDFEKLLEWCIRKGYDRREQ